MILPLYEDVGMTTVRIIGATWIKVEDSGMTKWND